MKVAIEGCCHGELDKIYDTLTYIENRDNIKVDLLIICGDFQAVRNESDLKAMAVPPKFQKVNTFYKYYSGEKKAPVLTIFVGGNHEASNYLQELPYGGWVAPNIYYLGYAGVVRFGGLRIAGLSGIYKARDYNRGHFEHPPYNEDTKRSCYHVRNVDVFRLKQVRQPLDIFLSHDWPRGIYHYGDTDSLIRRKRHFAEEIDAGTLGSIPAEDLLHHLKPDFWFAAHLHVKFAALVNHELEDGALKVTKFLSLDKCLPKRQFLQVLDISPKDDSQLLNPILELDPEWLCILRSTNHLLRVTNTSCYMPGPGGPDRYDFSTTDVELSTLSADFGGVFKVPDNFVSTVAPYNPQAVNRQASDPQIHINPQTSLICDMLGITDPFAVFSGRQAFNGSGIADMIAGPGVVNDDGDTNDSLDVDDRDEGILDDSDFIDSSFATANSTFNPDEISLEDIDDDDAQKDTSAAEPPNKRLSLSPVTCYQDASYNHLSDSPHHLNNDISSDTLNTVEADRGSSSQPRTCGILKRRNLAIYSSLQDSSDESS